LTEHVASATITSSVRRLEVYSVGDESGADAVAGDIADQYIQVFFLNGVTSRSRRRSVRWLIESVGTPASQRMGFVPGSAALGSPALGLAHLSPILFEPGLRRELLFVRSVPNSVNARRETPSLGPCLRAH